MYITCKRLLWYTWLVGSAIVTFNSCQPDTAPLPYYGFHAIDAVTGDTLYHRIRDFEFIDQDSQLVTNAYFDGKIYVADFFFTSCPTICPVVKAQMMRIYEKYEADDRLLLLSHSIDVRRDTVSKLKQYAIGLGADSPRWRFVTGNRDSIYAITYDYISTALDNPDAPGGFDHSGWILLIDENRHIRAYADGTKPEKVDIFLKQIDKLLQEMENKKTDLREKSVTDGARR
ncbi:MAG: SCO family protein [Saprospiraceae bacterium]